MWPPLLDMILLFRRVLTLAVQPLADVDAGLQRPEASHHDQVYRDVPLYGAVVQVDSP